MTRNYPGYPLPSGELGEDEIVCQLVYLPNRDEYWQALLGAISYMSTWRAWERDDNKRGRDAAANWREAFELTIGCWRMTCLDEIVDRMDEIINLIGLRKDCCDDNITYAPQVVVETDIVPDQGDPPEFYGETEVEDWEDWAEHVCHNAHIYVDILKHKASEMDTATVAAAWTIGFIAAALAALSFVGIGLAIVYGLAALTAGGLLAATTEGVFTNTEDDIEAARNDIVCALLQGLSLAQAVEDALSSGLDWDLFFQFVDYDTATAILYEGGYEQEYLPPDIRDDCECLEPAAFTYTFDEDLQGWAGNNYNRVWNESEECIQGRSNANEIFRGTHQFGSVFYTDSGEDAPFFARKLRYDIKLVTNGGAEMDFRWRIAIWNGSWQYGPEHAHGEIGWDNDWVTFTDDVGIDCQINTGLVASFLIQNWHDAPGLASQWQLNDNIAIIEAST